MSHPVAIVPLEAAVAAAVHNPSGRRVTIVTRAVQHAQDNRRKSHYRPFTMDSMHHVHGKVSSGFRSITWEGTYQSPEEN